MYALNGRVGLVTGGGAGIGRAIARRLARDGMAVAVLDRNGEAAQTVAIEIDGLAVTADVTEPEEVECAVDATLARFEKIDVLVNNAGVAWMGPALDMPLEALRSMLAVNVEGIFIVSRAVLPHMTKRRSGSVVNLASWAGQTGPGFHRVEGGGGIEGRIALHRVAPGRIRAEAFPRGQRSRQVTALPGCVRPHRASDVEFHNPEGTCAAARPETDAAPSPGGGATRGRGLAPTGSLNETQA